MLNLQEAQKLAVCHWGRSRFSTWPVDVICYDSPFAQQMYAFVFDGNSLHTAINQLFKLAADPDDPFTLFDARVCSGMMLTLCKLNCGPDGS